MQQNYFNPYMSNPIPQQVNPNAVNINIISPQAFSNTPSNIPNQNMSNFYPLYGQNMQPMMPYPVNYNNLIQQPYNMANVNNQGYPQGNQQNPIASERNAVGATPLATKTDVPVEPAKTEEKKSAETKTKKVVPLTDEYIKSLENYMNNDNPKIRLIGTKEVLERFKEDENRKDNPSLIPLLNKALKDTSPAVRFLGLTMLQLGYSVGNDETVTILKEIQAQNKDKIGEDSLLASEILLNMSQGQKVDVPMTENEIAKLEQKTTQKQGETVK